jgi:hypothetical protein
LTVGVRGAVEIAVGIVVGVADAADRAVCQYASVGGGGNNGWLLRIVIVIVVAATAAIITAATTATAGGQCECAQQYDG